MRHKFSIRVDDKAHSLTKENGPSIGDIGNMLSSLEKVIERDGSKIVLSEVSGNCYRLDFTTDDPHVAENFRIVNKRIMDPSQTYFTPNEKDYIGSLNRFLKAGLYVDVIDESADKPLRIKEIPKREFAKHYF